MDHHDHRDDHHDQDRLNGSGSGIGGGGGGFGSGSGRGSGSGGPRRVSTTEAAFADAFADAAAAAASSDDDYKNGKKKGSSGSSNNNKKEIVATTTTTTDGDSDGDSDSDSHGHHHFLPVTFRPGPNDVVCQRGKDCHEHIGNQKFRRLVEQHLNSYIQADEKQNRQDKSQVITNIVRQLQSTSTSGRSGFVMKVRTCFLFFFLWTVIFCLFVCLFVCVCVLLYVSVLVWFGLVLFVHHCVIDEHSKRTPSLSRVSRVSRKNSSSFI